MPNSVLRHCLLVLLLSASSLSASAAKLILSAPPRESVQDGEKLYAPLARYLTELTGETVVYRHPGNWLRYQRDMRRDSFDIIFDGPHFASWRIKYYNHMPVAKLPGSLKFFLVARADNDAINQPRDLAAHKVCAIPPPNLTSLVLLARLDGPAREPIIEPARGGMKSVVRELMEGRCDGAMLRDSFYYKKLSEQQRSRLKIIYTSPEMPNQVITLSERVSAEQRAKIADALTLGSGIDVTRNIIQRFAGKNVPAFLPVEQWEYLGYSDLLEGVVLGWKKHH